MDGLMHIFIWKYLPQAMFWDLRWAHTSTFIWDLGILDGLKNQIKETNEPGVRSGRIRRLACLIVERYRTRTHGTKSK